MVADDGKNWRLSVSRQTSALGNWCNYTINGQTASGQFADYPELGVDSRFIYLTMVDFSGGSFVSNRILAIPAIPGRVLLQHQLLLLERGARPGHQQHRLPHRSGNRIRQREQQRMDG